MRTTAISQQLQKFLRNILTMFAPHSTTGILLLQLQTTLLRWTHIFCSMATGNNELSVPIVTGEIFTLFRCAIKNYFQDIRISGE